MRDPFKIEGPACISFSGGRTSGYMLWRILQAHDGTLPEDVVVCFANTGKEMPETLDFVKECGDRWNVNINWLEYRPTHSFDVVDYGSASRNGEPFMFLVEHRKQVPSPVSRFCTVELKVRTMHRYLKSIGFEEWTSVVGIRVDEPRRVAKLGRQDYGKHEEKFAPLATAGIDVKEVGEFWSNNNFDLRLPNMNGKTMHGNCDLCFLKGGDQVLSLIREDSSRAIWWMDVEAKAIGYGAGNGARFRIDRPDYREMYLMATKHGELFSFADESIEDCACTD
jgi:3'-phosphoadenosine 5'-phosphosulfate sulfotransferase (PAPS reductase)/FAD synthetase